MLTISTLLLLISQRIYAGKKIKKYLIAVFIAVRSVCIPTQQNGVSQTKQCTVRPKRESQSSINSSVCGEYQCDDSLVMQQQGEGKGLDTPPTAQHLAILRTCVFIIFIRVIFFWNFIDDTQLFELCVVDFL